MIKCELENERTKTMASDSKPKLVKYEITLGKKKKEKAPFSFRIQNYYSLCCIQISYLLKLLCFNTSWLPA